MELSYDNRVLLRQTVQHTLNQLLILDTCQFRDVGADEFDRGVVRLHVAKRFRHSAANDFAHDNPPRNDGQVRRERTFTTESPQHCEIIIEDCNKNLGAQIVDIIRVEADAARLGRVVNDVDEQPRESIYEITPGTAVSFQAALQKATIKIGQRHIPPVH